mmetsp:Transcript_45606/g.84761  ORF Transcript_45606/g.84761 Transcript_45606/m.84761 type:complete len:196 (-) Transcript_45606:161-748(-)
MTESATLHITECDVEPAAFEEVLNYLYTDSLSDGAAGAMGEWLLLAANKYGVEDLKRLCEFNLCRSLGVENVSSRLVLSDQAEADELKRACLSFTKDNAADVMETSGWAQVVSHQAGTLLLEVMKAMAGVSRGKNKRSAEEEPANKEAELTAVDQMSIATLRSELSMRSIDTSGQKSTLVRRLKEAITRSVTDGQ